MTEREGIVKGQIGEHEKGRKIHEKMNAGILAIGLLIPWSPVKAEDELRLPESPRITATLQPTARSEIKITPQKEVAPTEFSLEEHDPFSQEGMLESFIAEYSMMTDEQKKEVKTRVTTDPKTGATIYVSKRTADSYMSDLQEGQTNELLQAVTDNFVFSMPEGLNKETFVVVDQNPQTEEEMITLWKKFKGGDYNGYSSAYCIASYNGELIGVDLSNGRSPSLVGLITPLNHNYVAWQEGEYHQLILTDGLTAKAVYDPRSTTLLEATLQDGTHVSKITKSVPLEIPRLLGERDAILRKNLKDFLGFVPEMFPDPEEVRRFIRTGDAKGLKYLHLFPGNPAFFAIEGGEHGLKRQSIQGIDAAINFVNEIDPTLVDTFSANNLRTIMSADSAQIWPGGNPTGWLKWSGESVALSFDGIAFFNEGYTYKHPELPSAEIAAGIVAVAYDRYFSYSYEKDPDLYLQSAERARSIREFMRRYAGRPLNEKQYVLFRNIAESITKTYLYFPS